MTSTFTTIRVSHDQRERLIQLAAERAASISDTLDAALEALRRVEFYRSMAKAEAVLPADSVAQAGYLTERDAWLAPNLSAETDRAAYLRHPDVAESNWADAEAWGTN